MATRVIQVPISETVWPPKKRRKLRERRARRLQEHGMECRDVLFKQMEERRAREKLEKEINDEQARLWEAERVLSIEEEKKA